MDGTGRVTLVEARAIARQYGLRARRRQPWQTWHAAADVISEIRRQASADWQRDGDTSRETYARAVAADGILWCLSTGRASLGAERMLAEAGRDELVRTVESVSRVLRRIHSVAVGNVPYVLNTHPAAVRIDIERYGCVVPPSYLAMQAEYWHGLEPLTQCPA